MNRTKKKIGIRKANGFLRPMKKIRGSNNRKVRAIRIHSVSDTAFVMSTSFATYRIPRSAHPFFEHATKKVIQNVVGLGYEVFDGHKEDLLFYWYDLDQIWGVDYFKKYEIQPDVDKKEPR
jgi:hypothetical protein